MKRVERLATTSVVSFSALFKSLPRLSTGLVDVCVCLPCHCSVCIHANWLKGGVAMGVAHCKKVHNSIAQGLVERLVVGQRTANYLLGQTGKRGRGSGSGL